MSATQPTPDRYADIYVLPDGSIQLFTDGQISYEQGAAVTRAIEAAIGAVLPGFAIAGEIEQHKPGGASHVHVIGHTHHGH